MDAADDSLFRALSERASIDTIRRIVESNPNLLMVVDDLEDCSPLHFACNLPNDIQIIQYLVEKYPEALKLKDAYGNLPFHSACCDDAPLEVVRYLHEKYPEAIKIVGLDDDLPVHMACHKNASLEVVAFLLSLFPESIEATNNKGCQPLHCACSAGAELQLVKYLVKQSPISIKVEADQGLPLHLAGVKNVSGGVLFFLMECFPQSISIMNTFGQLPLHSACQGQAPVEIVHYLHLLYPEAIKITDGFGRLPLHYAKTLDNIKCLYREYPLSIKMKDKQGNLPLHHACQMMYPSPSEGVQFLVATYPNAIIARNIHGFLPVDCVLPCFFGRFPAFFEWLGASMKVKWIRVGHHILLRALMEKERVSLLDTSESSVWENTEAVPDFVFVSAPFGVFVEIMSFL